MKTPIAKLNQNNLYLSEVYRELERQAVRKGFFDLSEKDKVKLGAQEIKKRAKINTPIDTEPSSDLTQDVARLIFAMKRKGFVTQAEDLESRFVEYKKAENNLYNLQTDTFNDFSELAHKNDDVHIFPGDLGEIETPQRAAEKILAVVRKEPTGKTAKEAALSIKAELIKKSQDFGGLELSEDNSSGLTDEIRIYTDSVKKKLNIIADNILKIQNLSFVNVVNADGSGSYLHGQGNASSLFVRLTDAASYQKIDRFGAMYKNTFQGKVIPLNQWRNVIYSNLESISSRYTDTYNYIKSIGNYNVPGITDIINYNQFANSLADQVYNDMVALFNSARASVNKANIELDKLKIEGSKTAKAIIKLANLSTKNLNDTAIFAKRTQKAIPEIEKRAAWPITILIGFGQAESANEVKQAINSLKREIGLLLQEIATKQGEFVNFARSTLGRLEFIRKQLEEAISKYDSLKSQEGTLKEVNNLISILKNRMNGGEKYLLEGLREYSNFKDFDIDTIQLLEFIKKEIKKAEEK